MTNSRTISVLALLLYPGCALRTGASDPAPATPLTIESALGLANRVKPAYPRPIAWLDDSRYVAIDPAPDASVKYLAVRTISGESVPLFDRGLLERALAASPSVKPEDAKAWSGRTDFVFAPDHSALLVTGGSDLYVWKLGADRVIRLTTDAAAEDIPSFSPDGRSVAFVKGANLYVASIESAAGAAESPARALTTDGGATLLCGKLDWIYQEEVYGRGNWTGYFWSPDSTRIACLVLDEREVLPYTIVDHRKRRPDLEVLPYPKAGDANPRASLRILDVATAARVDADLQSYASDQPLLVRVHWRPDSSAVLLQVQDRIQTWLDLVAIDPASGAATRLFRDSTSTWTIPTETPIFAPDGKSFVWLSERDGFSHIYLYDSAGALVRRLTTGPWEVDVVHSISGREVWFSGDREDVKGSQLYAVSLDGGEPRRVTDRPGTHVQPIPPRGGAFVDEWSSLADPGDVRVLDVAGKTLREAATAKRELVAQCEAGTAEFVRFPARDGYELEGFWIRPRNFDKAKRYPVLQFTYSGPHAPQVLDRYLNRDVFWFHYLAQEGYHVFVCDNRTASGRGLESVKSVYRNLLVGELRDLEDAAAWIAKQDGVDGSRIGLFGWSYGGSMTGYALTHSKKWKVGIVGAPVTDYALYDSIYTERYMGLPADNAAGYAETSLMRAAPNASGEMLLIHGVIDENVHMQNTLQFAEALQRANKPFSMMLYPGNRHSVQDPAQKLHLYTTITRFLNEKL